MLASEITTQRLSSLLSDFLICESCYFVDRDHDRMQVGHPCVVCTKPSEGGSLYYGNNVHYLIDLIQEAFHSESGLNVSGRPYPSFIKSHNVSVIIFFCTLKEVLMDHLLAEIFRAQQLPEGVVKRLMHDNMMYSDQQNKLLPSLFGKKWDKMIEEISVQDSDYRPVSDFMREVAEARNKFVHEGRSFRISKEMAKTCVEKIWGVINIFVGAHNKYVHPLMRTRKNELSGKAL